MAWNGELVRQEAALDKLLKDQQRLRGIISLCLLDDYLERLLRAVMIDDKVVDDLMDDGQALQSFSIKARLAYALGLIPRVVRDDLTYLNKIRNALAHELTAQSFAESPICDWCRILSTAKAGKSEEFNPFDAYKTAFLTNVGFLAGRIAKKVREHNSRQDQKVVKETKAKNQGQKP